MVCQNEGTEDIYKDAKDGLREITIFKNIFLAPVCTE